MRRELQDVTPEAGEAIMTLIESYMVNVNVCLPGKVVKYNANTQYADIQPQLKRKYEDGTLQQLPVIPNVPVKHPRAFGGKARIHFPVSQGDDVTIVFSQRSLDNWKTQGGMTDPADRRKFHLSDCFALLGGSSLPDAFSVNDPQSIEIINDQGIIQIKNNGTVNLGDYSPTHAVGLADKIQTRLSDIESKLNDFISTYDGHTHPVTSAPGITGPTTSTETPLSPNPASIGSTKVQVVT